MLVTGGSSTGKSRSLLNAVQASLPDWHILLPKDPAAVREAADTGKIPSRTVIWLDDTPVERFITANEDGLSGADLHRLLEYRKPLIVIDSMWPSRYEALMARPSDSASRKSSEDPSRDARDALSLAREPVRVGEQFSSTERERAQSLAYRDARLEVALQDTQFGVTQALAGAPALVRRYRDAESANPNAFALMTAAVDARRVGSNSPLTGDFLREAALGYLTDRQRPALDPQFIGMAPDQFTDAVSYLTDFHFLPGNVAPLVPERGMVPGKASYAIADYLLQHVQQQRRNLPIPRETWDALLVHALNPGELPGIARSAESRLLYGYAERFLRSAVAMKPEIFWPSLSQWLLKHGRVDEVRARADTGDDDAKRKLADWLARNNCANELRQRADLGDKEAARELAMWLSASGELDELRRRADAGDEYAGHWFFGSPNDRDLLFSARKTHPAHSLCRRLVDRYYDLKRIDKVRELANFGDSYARRRLSGWLIANAAIDELRRRADEGDTIAGRRLALWLLKGRRIDELRKRSDAGDPNANRPLADLLVENGEVEELRQRADAGNSSAMRHLADLLVASGEIDELRRRADLGDKYMRGRLVHWLVKEGRIDELRQRADSGDRSARRRLAVWLAENNDVDELLERAESGEEEASVTLELWLAAHGYLDELRDRAGTVSEAHASNLLVDGLYDNDQVAELRRLADNGNSRARSRLAEWLARNGEISGLRDRTLIGDTEAAERLLSLARMNRITDGDRLVKFGLEADGVVAQGLV